MARCQVEAQSAVSVMTSAAAMQSAWRSHKARQWVQALRREDAAVVLQSHWRRRAAVKSYRAAIMCAPPCDDLWLLPRCASGTLVPALCSSVNVGGSTGIAVTIQLASHEGLRHDRFAPRCCKAHRAPVVICCWLAMLPPAGASL